MAIFLNCSNQESNKNRTNFKKTSKQALIQKSDCNRATYIKSDIKKLPDYICLPEGFALNGTVHFSDLSGDGKNDFMAYRYRLKKEFKDGDTIYWDFYSRNSVNDKFSKNVTLNNLSPPYLSRIDLEYIVKDSSTISIYEDYPLTFYKGLSFQVNRDTIKLSYKYDDSKGKTFVFVYSDQKSDWLLLEVQFIIGEVPPYWTDESRGGSEYYSDLHDNIFPIFTKPPAQQISIREFDLIEAFKHEEIETANIRDCYLNQFNDLEERYQSVWEFKFEPCYRDLEWPNDWKY